MTGGEGIEDKEEYNGYENCTLIMEPHLIAKAPCGNGDVKFITWANYSSLELFIRIALPVRIVYRLPE